MSAKPTSPPRIHVASPTTADDWQQAERLVGDLVDWITGTIGLNVRVDQHDSDTELASLPQFYRAPAGRMLLGFVEGVPAGTSGVHLMDPETAELRRVWIAPGARGNGLAPVMLQAAIETARELGARRIWLETVRGHMDKAIGIYRRAGFTPIPHYSSLHELSPDIVSLGLDLTCDRSAT